MYNSDDTTNNERKKFYEVVSKTDFSRHNNHFRCNDTSTTVSYYPMSELEKTVLEIEMTLNSKEYKNKYPWTGNDIKIMGMRKDKKIEMVDNWRCRGHSPCGGIKDRIQSGNSL